MRVSLKLFRWFRVAAVTLILVGCVNTSANQHNQTEFDTNSPDFKRGLDIILALAQEGNAQMQFAAALMYAEGKGVPVDQEKAAHMLQLSAEQGIPFAQYLLGSLYYEVSR